MEIIQHALSNEELKFAKKINVVFTYLNLYSVKSNPFCFSFLVVTSVEMVNIDRWTWQASNQEHGRKSTISNIKLG